MTNMISYQGLVRTFPNDNRQGVHNMTPLIIVLAAGTLFLGSFVQGMVGFGLGMVSVPLLSLFLDVKMAIPVMLPTY